MSSAKGGGYGGTKDKADLDNHSDQCNPNNPKYQGHSSGYQGKGDKADLDNHSDQLNPNNHKYQGRDGGYQGKGDKADLDNHSNQLNPTNSRYQGGNWKKKLLKSIDCHLWLHMHHVAAITYSIV